jgi:ATP-binding cassette, subfamily B, bacterial MsbA
MAILGLTTGAFAYLLGPALRFLLSGGMEGLGLLARFFPALADMDRERVLWLFPALLVAIGAVKGISYLGQFYWMGLFGQRVGMDVRRALFAKLCTLSPTQRSQALSGDLLARFVTDASAIELAATYALASYVRDGLQILVLVGVAISLHWPIALGALIVLPLAVIPASRLTRRFLERATEGQSRLGALAAQVQEGIQGVKVLQVFNARNAELQRFRLQTLSLQRVLTRAAWYRGAVPAVMELLAAAALAGVVAFSVGTRSISPDALISLMGALILIYQPAKDLGRVGQLAFQGAISGDRVFELLDRLPAVPEAPDARTLKRLEREIRFEDVWFDYPGRPALQGLSLSVPLGKVTALVGPSGGGKSTLVSLLLGFERPLRGRVSFDGANAETLSLTSRRAQFSLVTQDPLLFSGTIADNLRYARPSATQEELERAARLANAEEFITRLPRGYDTPVGERGVVLSGGQKQRVCLARALLADAPVLVLDEATSNLDPQGEREVQKALSEVSRGRTVLVIAHRLQSIADADNIAVLEQGRVVEQGTHGQLLATGGAYARLWSLAQASGAA